MTSITVKIKSASFIPRATVKKHGGHAGFYRFFDKTEIASTDEES